LTITILCFVNYVFSFPAVLLQGLLPVADLSAVKIRGEVLPSSIPVLPVFLLAFAGFVEIQALVLAGSYIYLFCSG
jgi:hypothetical protein